MKKITIIFTVLAFVLGIAIISCTKQATQTDPVITTAADAVVLDNTVADLSGLLDDYTAANPLIFVDPTLKAVTVDPLPIAPLALDKCAKVTYVKTPAITANVVTGATISFTIDFGTTGCVGADGKARRGTIASTYTWVKLGGWTRVSTVDLYQSDVHYVGTLTTTFGVTGPNNHAYLTEVSSLTVTDKDGVTKKAFSSNRQRELVEGNSPTALVKIWKVTGSSSFTNAKKETSTYTITNPLYRTSNCKGFVAGTVVTVSTAGVTTTVEYGAFTTYAAIVCATGFTITKPGANGGPSVSTFIKFGK